jgi:BirA family transcriptional regulator, biotin operon repressor / biotin---[acetyl-CoA-carboxylase] ligase
VQPLSAPEWTVLVHEEVPSTNDLAARQPAWTAVRAFRQTAGRGRFRRTWVSDQGGLWFSATLPTPGEPARWAILPLAAGWAVREALLRLGLTGSRLRWPNDLMVGGAKLGGILVERFRGDTAVVGIGLNIANIPEQSAPELEGQVARLNTLLPTGVDVEHVLAAVLARLAEAHEHIREGRIETMLPALNQALAAKRVSVHLNAHEKPPLQGAFLGVDAQGNLLVQPDGATPLRLTPLDVALLRELDNPA